MDSLALRQVLASWAWRTAAVSGAVAILTGAFGAHGLAKRVDPRMLKNWETAAHYHLIHAGAGLLAAVTRRDWSAVLFATGTALFSGSLYAMVLTDARWLGAITPIGGVLMTAGWLALVPWW